MGASKQAWGWYPAGNIWVPIQVNATGKPVIDTTAIFVGARVYHSVNQSIPDSAWTPLAFDSERWDTDTIHDNVTNNERLTAKTAGKYLIHATVMFAASAVGIRGVDIAHSGGLIIAQELISACSAFGTGMVMSTVWDMAVGEYVILQVYQDTGGPLNVNALPAYSPEFGMQRIG